MLSFHNYELWTLLFLVLYFAVLLILAIYGSHRYSIVRLYRKHLADGDPTPNHTLDDADLPFITVQLPIFNERYVVQRLIDAAVALDYPHDRLEIQVLDDSTDDTTELARNRVQYWQEKGVPIVLHHRQNRHGYKAGALEAGMHNARGEFIAIFDADFVPPVDFLRKTIHHFATPSVGLVQARWTYLNRDYSLLTRAQAVLLDGHFILEHTARHRSGRFFNFNGTAGIWRRDAILDAGGWQHDTLTEDLDLSYRAQLNGWQFRYLKDLTSPSELPVEMAAFKSQQHRWAKGAFQTAKKLFPHVLRADLPWRIKLEAFYHLTGNVAYLLIVILALLMPMATLVRIQQGWFGFLLLDLPIFFGATFSVCYFYWISQREEGRSTWEILRLLPTVLALGIGVSVNNARGVFEAIVGHHTPFVRTPKYAVDTQNQSWKSKLYIKRSRLLPLIELSLGVWLTFAIWTVLRSPTHPLGSLPFLLLFQFGFFYVGLVSLGQSLGLHRRPDTPTSP